MIFQGRIYYDLSPPVWRFYRFLTSTSMRAPTCGSNGVPSSPKPIRRAPAGWPSLSPCGVGSRSVMGRTYTALWPYDISKGPI